MSEQTLRIGTIGAGDNTRKMHLPGFASLPGVELEVVVNRSEESSRKVSEAFGIKRIAGHWKEVVEDDGVDAICIGTWPYLHAEISIAALEAGKHVLCEARMAMNLKEAREMARTAEAHPDLVLQIVPAPFTLPFDATVQKLLGENALGNLLEVEVIHATAAATDPNLPMTWRQNRALSGDNILSMGIFQETIHRWMGRNPAWLQAHAHTATPVRINPETGTEDPVLIPDAVAINGAFDSGAHFHYRFTTLQQGPERLGIRLHGTDGTLVFDGPSHSLTLYSRSSEQPLQFKPNEDQGWRVEADFVDSVRGGKPVRLTHPREGLAYMAFTDAVWQSLRANGARVTLPDPDL